MSETEPGKTRSGSWRLRKPPPPTRKLSLPSRVRGRFRRGADRLLAADVGWSLAFIAVSMLLVGTQRCGGDYERFSVGDTASRDIQATRDIHVVDTALSDERREEARAAVPEVYVHDPARAQRLIAEISGLFEDGRQWVQGGAQGETALDTSLPGDVRDVLSARQFDADVERALIQAVGVAMDGLVVGNKALLDREESILLIQLPGRDERPLNNFDEVIDLNDARAIVETQLNQVEGLTSAERRVLRGFAISFVDANVYADTEAASRRRDAAAAAVPPVMVRVPQGHVLVAKDERITAQTLDRLAAARVAATGRFGLREFVGLMFVVCLLAFFIYRYSLYHQRDFKKLKHLHALLVLMLLAMMLLTRAMLWLTAEVVDGLSPPFDRLDHYALLIPLGAGAILVALLANGRIATVYSAFAALMFAALNGWDFYLALWATLVQLSGVYAISTYRERAALLRVGLVVGGSGAVATLALASLEGSLEPLAGSLYGAGLAFLGGAVGVGLIVSFSLPPLEGLFHVLTDIRLLELSNVNNPLLSQLAVKAPGSYNHSLVVGTLAEEGARAIGANSLFCRVAAFYHDVGKINHPEYFVENQRGVNPHDRLAPSMSSLIIASHVKDGIKMAREAGLPEQIIDIIPQHHGTKLMTYFFEKAKSSTDPSLGPIKEEDFRYPGPKPQTREAAIFMLSDAIEAAARTVDEPTSNRLREMIRKVTSSIVLDGQLDECDLTFSDLDRIQDAFHRLLVSMYHHRVDYPGFDFNKPKGEGAKTSPDLQERKVVRGS